MKKISLLFLVLLWGAYSFCATGDTVSFKVFHTTDIHGNFFPFDFIKNQPMSGGFSRVSTYIKEQRSLYGNDVILLDSGDLLQGQPSVYYYNFVDTISTHVCAAAMNYIGYDAAAMGNHDIETGHQVYDRWITQCDFPVLGANILTSDGTSYLSPYKIIEVSGIKVAIIGMITQGIPAWLPENLWSGLTFADIEDTSRKLISEIKEQYNPDVIIGLFHTGVNKSVISGFKESVGLEVAHNVPGYDIILCGHDHTPYCNKIENIKGDSVLVMNPGAGGNTITNITVTATLSSGQSVDLRIDGTLDKIADIEPDPAYMKQFEKEYAKVEEFVNQPLGQLTAPVTVHDAWFGPSTLIDLLHVLQLELTQADISLVAPLSMSTHLETGEVYMRDMFNLYKYENLLYTIRLTGQELLNALEYSYSLWIKQMENKEDTLLFIEPSRYNDKYRFVNPYFAFDSAAGIIYTVDVSKPAGKRIHIQGMADGSLFDLKRDYKIAVSSYQGSGGGNILTDGAGLSRKELNGRLITSTDKDLRYYLASMIRDKKIIEPRVLNQWKFIPEEWVEAARAREMKLLYGE